MMKHRYKKLVLALFVLLCTAFIFCNSLKDSTRSNADSTAIADIVEKWNNEITADKSTSHNKATNWNFVVRKAAHLIEFFVLGIATTAFLLQMERRYLSVAGGASIYTVLIAMTDEFIQRFTGRSSLFEDVVLDSFGALSGIFLMLLLHWMFMRGRHARAKMPNDP